MQSIWQSQHNTVNTASVLSHTMSQQYDRSQTQAPPMLVCKYMDCNSSPAAKRLTGVTPEVNLRILLHTSGKAHK